MPKLSDITVFSRVGEPYPVPAERLAPNTRIHMDDLPWVGFIDPRTNEPNPHVFSKVLMPNRDRYSAALIWHDAGFTSSPHWHPSDTLYIPLKGQLHVIGEGTYGPGDVRWVKGGTAYDAEQTGSEPLESILISFGPMGRFDADEIPAPNGDTRKKK